MKSPCSARATCGQPRFARAGLIYVICYICNICNTCNIIVYYLQLCSPVVGQFQGGGLGERPSGGGDFDDGEYDSDGGSHGECDGDSASDAVV